MLAESLYQCVLARLVFYIKFFSSNVQLHEYDSFNILQFQILSQGWHVCVSIEKNKICDILLTSDFLYTSTDIVDKFDNRNISPYNTIHGMEHPPFNLKMLSGFHIYMHC